jgi:hypothetical protein
MSLKEKQNDIGSFSPTELAEVFSIEQGNSSDSWVLVLPFEQPNSSCTTQSCTKILKHILETYRLC